MDKQLTDGQIEQLIIRKLYTDSNYYQILSTYRDEKYFSDKSIPKLLDILVGYKDTYGEMPTVDLANMIIDKYAEGGDIDARRTKLQLSNAMEMDITNEDFIRDNIITYLKEKASYWTIMEQLDDIQKTKDVSNCIEEFQKIQLISIDENDGFDYFEQQDEHWDEVTNPLALISTGFEQLDYPINGGWPVNGKCLIVFMAQANAGKSLMMSNIAVNMLEAGKFVIIVSLEMCELVYGKRVDAHISLENVNQLNNVAEHARRKIDKFKDLNPDAKLIIKEYPPNSINTLTIQNYIENQIQQVGRRPDAIFIDYLNLLEPNKRTTGGMYERVGDVARDMRALSYKFKCPVISATQTNRDGWDTSDVSMANVSESAGIAHTADYMGCLWQADGDREQCKINNTTLKNRFGMVGHNGELRINYENLRMRDMDVVMEAESDIISSITNNLSDL